MGTTQKNTNLRNNIIYTSITAILILAVFLLFTNLFYSKSIEDAYTTLKNQTEQLQNNIIEQQKISENYLLTLEHLCENTYKTNKNFTEIFNTFEENNFISEIGILTKENQFITKTNVIDLSENISFYNDLKQENLYEKIRNYIKKEDKLIQSSIPIKYNNETVAILFGITDKTKISNKYNDLTTVLDSQLIIYDNVNKDYIINNNNSDIYKKVMQKENYGMFELNDVEGTIYLSCVNIPNTNFDILLYKTEQQVFEKARMIAKTLYIAYMLMLFIVLVYLLYFIKKEKQKSLSVLYTASIRKVLLDVNKDGENITTALKNVETVTKSKTAFFVDANNKTILCSETNNLFKENKDMFVSRLIDYSSNFCKINRTNVGIISIETNKKLLDIDYDLYNCLAKDNIKKIILSIVFKDENLNILGVINTHNEQISKTILEDIAICFALSLNNKKYLNKIEENATIDTLTKLKNRRVYTEDLETLNNTQNVSCIYIDANELHLRNNKFGHEAGDEMLKCIANTLKGTFQSQEVYRIGGDEFVVFTKNMQPGDIQNKIKKVIKDLKTKSYNISTGMAYRRTCLDVDGLIKEAEAKMNEEKTKYYQNKERQKEDNIAYVQTKTGIAEIDKTISILQNHYNSVFKVSLDTNKATKIFAPSYLGDKEIIDDFSKFFVEYIVETAHPDFHRTITSFTNYDMLKKQIKDNVTPQIIFKKLNEETISLTIHSLENTPNETLWVFEKVK